MNNSLVMVPHTVCIMYMYLQVERFKHRQCWEDALHARFDCHTGDAVMDDETWGHLQVLCVREREKVGGEEGETRGREGLERRKKERRREVSV